MKEEESNRRKIKRGFNRLAPLYDSLTAVFFGRSLIHSQLSLLSTLPKVRSVLILGGGTGLLLCELLKREISEKYCYVDLSEKMILAAQKKTMKQAPHKAGTITFICGSYESVQEHDPFDLIITPYVLDCLGEEELKEAMPLLYSRLRAGGHWLFVDFNISKHSPAMNLWSTAIVRCLYAFFNVLCHLNIKALPDFAAYFSELPLQPLKEQFFLKGLLSARIYQKKSA